MNTDFRDLKQRLEMIGCNVQQIEQITDLLRNGKKETIHLLLRRHRKQLMDELHESEKRVDDLDLLVYQIDKSKF